MTEPEATIHELLLLGLEEGYSPEQAKTVAAQCIWLEREAREEDMSDIESYI